mmetsp:Transcript_127270/g.220248  ORF Transcript_127270/g.220248 Transcript_127270/m.220248 type:complete len:211 (+) Transcript_127270:656-1288(+)
MTSHLLLLHFSQAVGAPGGCPSKHWMYCSTPSEEVTDPDHGSNPWVGQCGLLQVVQPSMQLGAHLLSSQILASELGQGAGILQHSRGSDRPIPVIVQVCRTPGVHLQGIRIERRIIIDLLILGRRCRALVDMLAHQVELRDVVVRDRRVNDSARIWVAHFLVIVWVEHEIPCPNFLQYDKESQLGLAFKLLDTLEELLRLVLINLLQLAF